MKFFPVFSGVLAMAIGLVAAFADPEEQFSNALAPRADQGKFAMSARVWQLC
jgi:hypothetical protein